MSARLHLFHGTEADSETPMVFGLPRGHTDMSQRTREPLTDDDPLSADERAGSTIDDWPTTRRFARSLHGVDSAFPRDPEYAQALDSSFAAQDKARGDLSWKWANLATLAIALLVVVGLIARWW